MMQQALAREQLLQGLQIMHADKLTVGKTGNMSCRCEGGFVVSPTGMAYERLQLQDLVFLNLQGQGVKGERLPSSEWHFHCDIYNQKPDVNAIVHTHSQAATALSCLHRELPPFHYMVSLFGGGVVPCAEYATFGTPELSANVLRALKGYSACLMASHGMLVAEKDMATAYQRAQELESLCDQYLRAKSVAEVILLTDEQMAEAKLAFAQYGQASS